METPSVLPAVALLPSAAAIPCIVLSGRRPGLRDACSVAAALAQTALVAAMVPAVLEGGRPAFSAFTLVPGVPLLLRADALGVLFATVASALWILTTFYSIGYVRALDERRQTSYFAAFATCLFATVGLALAGNLLTFFVFFEVLTVAAYPLVVHKGSPEAMRAGRVYLTYTLTAGAALLAAIVGTFVVAGRLDFEPGGIVPAGTPPGALWMLLGLFVLGCGVKAALVPLHTWLPVAMIAPTPVSALLHAVAVVKAGVFGLVRVVGFVFGAGTLRDFGGADLLAAIALVTIVFGSLLALAQTNLKRLLAFSTVSQLSYVVLGVAVGAEAAFAGGVLHIVSHALLKITLFFCAGALHVGAHVEGVGEMAGIGRRMPLTMTVFAVAALLLAGLPPGAAFLSKWRLLEGAASAGAVMASGALLLSTVLNLAYFAPIVTRAFFAPPGPAAVACRDVPATMLVPLAATLLAGLGLGLLDTVGFPAAALAQAVAREVGAATR
ncbi:MAG TPA: proton-conducting transporter membrane subunit [Candidatus Tectomicrobia bacterium]|nr:proton-conducting transporter membrane subunit [Candidatus Tectomicrobia bacterium]